MFPLVNIMYLFYVEAVDGLGHVTFQFNRKSSITLHRTKIAQKDVQ